MNEFLLALVAGISFTAAGMFGLVGVRVSTAIRLASIAVAAGVLLAVTISDLIPDAFEMAGRSGTAIGFVTGFLILFTLEALTHAHIHHHSGDDHHMHDHSGCEAHHSPKPFVLGLALHNLTDGLAIGTTTALSHGAAAAVTAGVLVHQLPVGISFAAVLASIHTSRNSTIRDAVICGAMIPLGAVLVLALPDLSERNLGVLIAGAAGALTYVAAGHLLPEAQSEQRHPAVAPIFAIAMVATTAWFTVVSTG